MILVERVARVICAKSFENSSIYWGDDTIPAAVDRNWKDYVGEARASLAAIRVPTEDMLIAARNWSGMKYGKPIGDDDATGCWQVMIDAALRE